MFENTKILILVPYANEDYGFPTSIVKNDGTQFTKEEAESIRQNLLERAENPNELQYRGMEYWPLKEYLLEKFPWIRLANCDEVMFIEHGYSKYSGSNSSFMVQ